MSDFSPPRRCPRLFGRRRRLPAGNKKRHPFGCLFVIEENQVNSYGKRKRTSPLAVVSVVSLEAKLPESSAFLSQFWRRAPEVTCWALPSPSMMFPAPARLPAECSLADQPTAPELGTEL